MSKNMLQVKIGDMFESKAQTLVNTVNCVGVMGKGIAAEFKKRFPDMFEQYQRECEEGSVKQGKLNVYKNLFNDEIIINFPTKKHWKSPTLVKDIEDGLDYFVDHYKEWGVESVAFPPLGCGNGGLDWGTVGPIMYEKLKDLDIDIQIFAPYGTPAKELTKEFLSKQNQKSMKKGRWLRGTLQPGEIAVLEVLYRLQNERFAKPIGRTMYQKACYILDKAGVDTGYMFTRNSYGPYSDEAARTLSVYANNNLTREEHVGKMFKLNVTENYEEFRTEYKHILEQNKKGIDKAVDLLSRIKDTEQGEEVATVMYAAETLARTKNKDVTAKNIQDFIFDWKKRWASEEKKKASISETINALSMLDWLDVSPTSA